MKCQIYPEMDADVEVRYNSEKFILSKKALLEFGEKWTPHLNAGLATISIRKLFPIKSLSSDPPTLRSKICNNNYISEGIVDIKPKLVDIKTLEIGSLYIIQFFGVSFIGKLHSFDKRYSQKWIQETVTIKKKEVIVDKLVLNKPQYDVLIFKAEAQKEAEDRGIVKRMFTSSEDEQFYFTHPLIFENNIIKDSIHDWAISKIIDTNGAVISQRNLSVTVKIARSMMEKAGYTECSINLILEKVKTNASEIIDIKQCEWTEMINSQINQMPF